MALDNYTNLTKSIVLWGHRKDVNELLPDFIALAETEMYNNEGWQLETRDMETITTLTTSGIYLDLPVGFEKARAMKVVIGTDFYDVVFQSPSQLRTNSSIGRPCFFSVIGNKIEFDRVPDQDYSIQIQYYKKPDPITPTNQTNSVLTNHPNIYLFGALHQLFMWAEDEAEAIKYFSKFQSVIRGANKAAKKARFGANPYASTGRAIP